MYNIKVLNFIINIKHIGRQHIYEPEMQGVRTPSPMTMEVPNKVAKSKKTLANWLLSSLDLSLDASFSRLLGTSSLKFETSESSACWLGVKLIFACRHKREYSANVPPTQWIDKYNSKWIDKYKWIIDLLSKMMMIEHVKSLTRKHSKQVLLHGQSCHSYVCLSKRIEEHATFQT